MHSSDIQVLQMYNRCYSELIKLKSFEERFEYLNLNGRVGDLTFNGNRYLNQMLYKSARWKIFRNDIIIRDNGCDLGIKGREIYLMKDITVHHINPISVDDVINERPCVFDPENVICTTDKTHKGIHYGSLASVVTDIVERTPFDTSPWRR